MERVFNMGVGMVAVVAAADAGRALRLLADRNTPAWAIGGVTAGTGTARLTGQHPA
jgi:phosphoribosylformylglycinamidine cyclo-ligase